MSVETCKLVNHIDFNDDEFSKKVLLENGESKLMLVALKKDQKMPEHNSPVEAIAYILEGEVAFKFDDEELLVKEHEAVKIPANKNHCVKGLKNSKFIVARI